MADEAAEFTGTTAVREALRFDEARLEHWLAHSVAGYAGPMTVELFKGGQSNPTYKVITPEKTYVLRRKPPGPLLKGAHAIEREACVIKALAAVDYPVPRVHGVCTDEHVIGTPFYVMDWIDGRIFWDATLPRVSRESRTLYYDAINQTIARLHRIDYAAVGLREYGRAGKFIERQIARWSQQYAADSADAGRDVNMDRLIAWLPAHIPSEEETTLVHGDFRIDNLVFHPTEARIIAVLDWELSTLGHPLVDFSYHLMMYRLPPRIIAGLAGMDLPALNIPSETEYVEAYCRRTDRRVIAHLDFYLIFNMFRMAAIFHGIKARVARGTAASARAKDYAAELDWMAAWAWEHAQ